MSKVESRKKEAFRWVKIYTPLFLLALLAGRIMGNDAIDNSEFDYYKSVCILMICFYAFCGMYVWGLALVSAMRSKYYKEGLKDV